MRTALLPFLLIASQAAAQPPRLESGLWHCTFTEQLRCESGRACVPIELNVKTLLDPAGGRYLRCWNSLDDCDAQTARFATEGRQLVMQVPGSGTFAKLAPDLTVTEVSSIGPIVFIERGHCAPGPLPSGRITILPPG